MLWARVNPKLLNSQPGACARLLVVGFSLIMHGWLLISRGAPFVCRSIQENTIHFNTSKLVSNRHWKLRNLTQLSHQFWKCNISTSIFNPVKFSNLTEPSFILPTVTFCFTKTRTDWINVEFIHIQQLWPRSPPSHRQSEFKEHTYS